MSEPVVVAVYELKFPVTHAGIEYKKLEFVRPKLKHYMEMDKVTGDMARLCELIQASARIPAPVAEELAMVDINEINALLMPFT